MATKRAPVVCLTQKDGWLWLTAPYNPEANNRYKAVGGKWMPDSKLWRFNPAIQTTVLSLIESIFGCEMQVGETATAIKGTEYLGKGTFRKVRALTDASPFTVDDEPEGEQTTFEKAKMVAANLAVHMMALTEQQKEELFKIAFGDE